MTDNKNGTGITSLQFVNDHKKEQARNLRKNATPAEKVFWHLVRRKKVKGLKFRRQQVIEGFIADFFCESAKLVIEVDGSIHNTATQKKIDAYREEVFRARGLITLRFSNDEVFRHSEDVVRRIVEIVGNR